MQGTLGTRAEWLTYGTGVYFKLDDISLFLF